MTDAPTSESFYVSMAALSVWSACHSTKIGELYEALKYITECINAYVMHAWNLREGIRLG